MIEHAGCSSCADRIRTALEPLAVVERLEVDEAADVASVTVAADTLSEHAVGSVLAAASVGSGHEYRIAPGSWRSD